MLTLKQIVKSAQKMVFFGGAGVSTESGIPDFRGAGGLYQQKLEVPPEVLLSHDYFQEHPESFFRFYREKMLVVNAKPGAAHQKLADWERQGRLLSVITQNIDGLHQAAGSQRVWELHGSIHRNTCLSCGRHYSGTWVQEQTETVPRCCCGGIVKPDVVLYGEGLDEETLEGAVLDLCQADVLLVAGTSLSVYPAAGLLRYFRGKHLVLINKTPTPMDDLAELVLREPVGQVLSQLP